MSDTSGHKIHEGDKVAWNWGSAHVEGNVAEISDGTIEKDIKGKHITRQGSEDNPALYIERKGQKNPTPVVKKASEVHVLEGGEHPKSNEHVETRRQKEMNESKSRESSAAAEEDGDAEEEQEDDDFEDEEEDSDYEPSD
ncbi:hypothetical protein DFS34DRAFT_694560 [Phlyctochytrium arcticum]|nr:hypothetical protein DFS34DRAFT_694560 [Phlyctochytrium arcticum]